MSGTGRRQALRDAGVQPLCIVKPAPIADVSPDDAAAMDDLPLRVRWLLVLLAGVDGVATAVVAFAARPSPDVALSVVGFELVLLGAAAVADRLLLRTFQFAYLAKAVVAASTLLIHSLKGHATLSIVLAAAHLALRILVAAMARQLLRRTSVEGRSRLGLEEEEDDDDDEENAVNNHDGESKLGL